MPTALVPRLTVLVIASLFTGCQSPYSRTNLGADSAIVPTMTSLGAADTGFIEERRYEETGIRTPDGKCRARPQALVRYDRGPRRIESGRMTMIDPNKCLFLVMRGYRKSLPAEMEAPLGTGGISAGASFPPGTPPPPTPP
jgi:hypothetical protein